MSAALHFVVEVDAHNLSDMREAAKTKHEGKPLINLANSNPFHAMPILDNQWQSMTNNDRPSHTVTDHTSLCQTMTECDRQWQTMTRRDKPWHTMADDATH